MVRTGEAGTNAIETARQTAALSWWWVALCALAILALPLAWRPLLRIAALALPESAPAASAGPPTQLGFSASRQGSDWRLVWNRAAITRFNAVGAMLAIRDGGVDRLQFLSPQDLAAGTILYVPRTSELSFHLKVAIASGVEVEEEIRVLGAGGDTPQLFEPVQPRIGEASRAAPPAPVRKTPVRATRPFQPPARSATRTGASVPDIALPEPKLPAASSLRILHAAPSAPPPPRLPADPVRTPAPSSSRIAEPSRTVSPPVSRVEPTPIRTVRANWPRERPRLVAQEVRILVRLDLRGRVVGAVPMSRTVTNFPFVDSALTAARMWTFSPAFENGKPVPSETVLTFKFTP